MSPVLTRHAPEPVRKLRRVAAPIALIVAVLALFALVLDLVTDAATVERVSLANRTEIQVEVGVADAQGRVLWLAAVEPGTRAVVDDVLDQGETWVVRAEHGGVLLGERRLTHEELERREWEIVIPAEWGDAPRR